MTEHSLPIRDPSDYKTDTIWNLVAFAIQAAAGAILTIGLFFFSGAEYLGIFNQLYAIFVVAGQFFVFGIHDSVLKHSAEFYSDKIESERLAFTALILGCIGALIGFGVILVGANTITEKFYSQHVQFGLILMSPGIFLFVINKVLLGLLNGRQQFKQFAIAQALRAIALVIFVFSVTISDIEIGYIGACFTLAELTVFFSQIRFTASIWRGRRNSIESILDMKFWGKTHFTFGILSLPHGFLSESFIRIDILVLAFFVDDATIGIYSFAAFFVEGVYQISILVRNITNPRLVRILRNRDRTGLWVQAKKSCSLSFLLTLTLSAIIFGLVSFIGPFFDVEQMDTISVLMSVIFPGLIVYSLFVPLDYALLQGGKPAVQSTYMLTISLLNLALNIILIPVFGFIGAAIGTAIAMSTSGIFLMVFLYFTFSILEWPKKSNQCQ